MHHPKDRIVHTTAFVKPLVGHWLDSEKEGRKEMFLLLLFHKWVGRTHLSNPVPN